LVPGASGSRSSSTVPDIGTPMLPGLLRPQGGLQHTQGLVSVSP
jgi:hypothetical protein